MNCDSSKGLTVGGTVSGLTGTLVLQINEGDNLSLSQDGEFTFSEVLTVGTRYTVSVLSQPTGQYCSIVNPSGIILLSNVTNVAVTCSSNTFSIGGSVSGLSGTVVLQNNGGDDLTLSAEGAFVFSTPLADGTSYVVTILTQPEGQSCVLSNASGVVNGANVSNVQLVCAASGPAVLSASVSDLALSVTGYTEYGVTGTPNSGLPRVITITNIGVSPANNLSVTDQGLPGNTDVSTSCGSSLAPNTSCTITVTPGSTANSDGSNPCTQGTAPISGSVSVTADNSNSVSTNVVVLGYGCIYQGGYVYALDDSVLNSSSVGGKVTSLSDQSSGVVWSADSAGAYDGGVAIYGISSASTSSSPDPASGQVAGQLACDGSMDGSCNTNNIYVYYQNNATGAPINLSYYAAGLCKQTINSYSDWYLPAMCEMGPDTGNAGTGCGVPPATPTLQNMQSSLVDYNSLNLLSGNYWSSTEVAMFPLGVVEYQFFGPNGTDAQFGVLKSVMVKVRCSRQF